MRDMETVPDLTDALMYLPVCWANLDPAKIPTPGELDILLANSAANNITRCPFFALDTIQFLPNIPRQALVDLWTRVWPWIQFHDTYGDIIPTASPRLNLYYVFFQYLDRVPTTLVSTTPGIRAFVAKAWVAYVEGGNPDAGGFDALLRFIASDCAPTCDDARLAAYAAGVGDSVDQLAALVCEHFLVVKEHRSPGFVQMVVRFALAIGAGDSAADSEFHICLRRRGVVAVLTQITCGFNLGLLCFPKNGLLKATVTECLSLLTRELCHPSGYLWIPDAIRAGLLKVLTHSAYHDQMRYIQLLLTETHKSTVYYSVLREIEHCFPELMRQSPFFSNAAEIHQWAAFIALAKDRLELKKQFDSADYVEYWACDNLLCCKIMRKSEFRTCADCSTTHYCDASCQRLDWPYHREFCGSLRTTHRSNPLTARNKSFMRALVQQTHRRNLGAILQMQTRYTASSGRSYFLITHDYTNGIPDLGVASTISHERGIHPDMDIQQIAHGRRAARDPRIVLSVVRFPGLPLMIIPMRSLNTRLHKGLIEVAQELRDGVCEAEALSRKLKALESLDTLTAF
ncbi:hypothetical protein C8R47DRAFT_1062484 [Mycena vitilis]|nr:hypothetical protein C8R47DRAFT_1062484 [Mycena vitilis]